MKTLLTILLFLMATVATGESESAPEREYFQVGRYLMEQSEKGYSVYSDGHWSDWHMTALRAIDDV